jgi:uncharacterized membrane protein
MTDAPQNPRWQRVLLAPLLIAAGVYVLWDMWRSRRDSLGTATAPPTVLADSATMALAQADSLRLHGNEPFWSVDITPGAIVYRTPENMEGLRFPPAPAQAEGRGRRYSVSSSPPESHTLEIQVEAARCNDGMSDSTYPFTARVVIDGRNLRGCGRLEPPDSR